MTGTSPRLEDEVVRHCVNLIRIDSSNRGEEEDPGERRAAEYVMASLQEAGLQGMYVEGAPGRANVVLRMPGVARGLPALLVHGHLDVVPVDGQQWSVPPFGGELIDGSIWGHGAVDMKDMDAMMLALACDMARTGRRPRRDVVFAWLADEEQGGRFGARFIADEYPDLIADCAHAISEVGGYSVDVGPNIRLYLVEVAQKGLAWLRLTAEGRTGHAAMLHSDNAVTDLAQAISRIGTHSWPLMLTPATRRLLEQICECCGIPFSGNDLDEVLLELGTLAQSVGATLQHTANPTRFRAGYSTNVVPEKASAEIDGRYLPGMEQDFLATISELAGPRVSCEVIDRQPAIEVPFEGRLVDTMLSALRAEDPVARTVPYCLAAGTDNRTFHELGIVGYGFVPLRLPAGFDFSAMFHGVDERIPVDALEFGVRVLDRFLNTY